MQPKMPLADFEALIRRAGLALTPEQVAELYTGWASSNPCWPASAANTVAARPSRR